MDPASAIDFARSAILVLLEIIAPTMLTALVVGLGIGLLQAVTQIQEQTLVFVPKIVAIFVVLLLALPFAGAALSGLMTDCAGRIACYEMERWAQLRPMCGNAWKDSASTS